MKFKKVKNTIRTQPQQKDTNFSFEFNVKYHCIMKGRTKEEALAKMQAMHKWQSIPSGRTFLVPLHRPLQEGFIDHYIVFPQVRLKNE